MENYLICYYILKNCFFETFEEDLNDLLTKLSPELWEDGHSFDKEVFKEWSKVFDENDDINKIRQNLYNKLEEYENQKGLNFTKSKAVLKDADINFLLHEARFSAQIFMAGSEVCIELL